MICFALLNFQCNGRATLYLLYCKNINKNILSAIMWRECEIFAEKFVSKKLIPYFCDIKIISLCHLRVPDWCAFKENNNSLAVDVVKIQMKVIV